MAESQPAAGDTVPARPMLDCALDYAAMDWKVFPIYAPSGAGCSCDKGASCHAPGKHPITGHGQHDATADPALIRRWWKDRPTANIGVSCRASGILVIDDDPRNGGTATLAALFAKHGSLPETLRAATGGGGWHYLFANPLLDCVGKLGPGVDVKDKGYIVVAPSGHVSGKQYAWVDPVVPIAAPPAWLIELLSKPPAPSAKADAAERFPEGQRNSGLASLGGTMRHRGMSAEAIEAALIEENQVRCDPPLEESEVRAIAKSVARYAPADPASAPSATRNRAPAPSWPKPLGPKAFHGLAGRFVAIVSPHSESDPVGLLIQFHAAFGSAVGRKPHFAAEADKHRGNLFACLVGETSKGRKGVSWGQVRRPFTAVDQSWAARIASGLSSGEGLIHHVRDADDPASNKKSLDPGVSDKRLLVFQGEFASVLGVMEREGNTLSSVLRLAWDTGDLQVMTRNNPIKATGAHISIIGHITMDELRRKLGKTEMANGFGNRFLWILVKRSKLLPDGGNLGNDDLVPLVQELSEALAFAKAQPDQALPRTPQARELWFAAYPQLSEGAPGLFGAMTSRGEAQVMRLALLYALQNQSPSITVEHLEAALELWRYAEDSARFLWGDSIGDPDADALLWRLRDAPGGLTRTEISDSLGNHWAARRIESALATLERLKLAERTAETTAGRPAERWTAVQVKPVPTLSTLISPQPTTPEDQGAQAAEEAKEAEEAAGCLSCVAGLRCPTHPNF